MEKRLIRAPKITKIFTYLILTNLLNINAFALEKTIYGTDDRVEYYSASNMHQELAKSTAAMIRKSYIYTSGNISYILGPTLREKGICKSERFSEQVAAASCSGFLVDDDLLVTAGHCIEDKKDCQKYLWVFDYRIDYPGDTAKTVSKNSIYKCKKIIERELTGFPSDNDYALIKLDRKVDRRPLRFRKKGKVKKGTKLFVVGHPSGLPTKIALNGVVRKRRMNYFYANVDTFGGNSGSAVFNQNGMVEGILVRGKDDYEAQNGCKRPNSVRESAFFSESVTYITNIHSLQDKN